MLYSVELRLRISDCDNLRQVTGYHMYALFLRLMQMASPALATNLHADGGPKPFTLSLLNPISRRRQGAECGGAMSASLRLTFLREQVFAAFLDAVSQIGPEPRLSLGSASVVCEAVLTTPAQSPLAAFNSFEELLDSADVGRRLSMRFLSPTTFRSRGQRNVLFPEPTLVWGSLLARWNAFAPPGLSLGPYDLAHQFPRLSSYHLTTRMLDFGSYQEVGFLGRAGYEIAESIPDDHIRALGALAAFAHYGGVGAKTTMGMGQVGWVQTSSSDTGARPTGRSAQVRL